MKTSLAAISHDSIEVLGQPIERLIAGPSFAGLILRACGQPDARPAVKAAVESLIVGFCDHGLSPPSTIACRLAASCGADLSKALIAALACMGDTHAPVSAAYDFLQQNVASSREAIMAVRRVPGFGHPIHATDPRVQPLFDVVDSAVASAPFCRKAREIEGWIGVPLNYAGAAAAASLDLGLSRDFAQLAPLLGRLVGLTAHYAEQKSAPNRVICYDESTGKFLD